MPLRKKISSAALFLLLFLFAAVFLSSPARYGQSVLNGFMLWAGAILPTALPLLVVLSLMVRSPAFSALSRRLSPAAEKLFRIPGVGAGAMLLSVLSSSTLLVFAVSFMNSEGAFTGMNVIIGTVTGFLIGAYIPVSSFPEAVRYVTLFVPGSYSAALFRSCFMDGALQAIGEGASLEFAEELLSRFAVRLDFFGTQLSSAAAAGILAGTAALFGACCFVAAVLRMKNNKI